MADGGRLPGVRGLGCLAAGRLGWLTGHADCADEERSGDRHLPEHDGPLYGGYGYPHSGLVKPLPVYPSKDLLVAWERPMVRASSLLNPSSP